MKRRRFQIHLSTAVVLMMVAALILWLNLQSKSWNPPSLSFPGIVYPYTTFYGYGWPIKWYEIENHEGQYIQGLGSSTPFIRNHVLALPLIINLVLIGMIFYLVVFICEWLIRRREARTP
jgi:hypothetical protein